LIQLPHNDRAEERIASTVARLSRVNSALPPIKVDAAVQWAEQKAGFVIHELQRTAVRAALTSKLSILTGGPGTGTMPDEATKRLDRRRM
jgi:exodeoxyribonuclease V alpha subunit